MEINTQSGFQNDKSYLTGKPTSFKNITCRGAKFINIKNRTNARLPSDKELLDAPVETGILASIKRMLKL